MENQRRKSKVRELFHVGTQSIDSNVYNVSPRSYRPAHSVLLTGGTFCAPDMLATLIPLSHINDSVELLDVSQKPLIPCEHLDLWKTSEIQHKYFNVTHAIGKLLSFMIYREIKSNTS